MVNVLERSLNDNRSTNHIRAQAIAALSIGGMVVARALVNKASADELRTSCLEIALRLGNWQRPESKIAANKKHK
jgi:TetR/AcrR family transcriptional regulator, transcriptional repressor for nem operon